MVKQEQQEEELEQGLVNKVQLKEILEKQFPKLEFAFGYGSGVFRQVSYNYQKEHPMVDLIFVCEDIEEFHQENMKLNPNHYSGLGKLLGPKYLKFLQTHILPIHFNPMIQINDRLKIKYGVIEKKKFVRDVMNWDTLICAGRLHKPVKIILDNDISGSIQNALSLNLVQACSVTLLLNFTDLSQNSKYSSSVQGSGIKQQNDKFKNPFEDLNVSKVNPNFIYMEYGQFFFTLSSLSYVGDVRYKLGAENANKIENIINGNMENFIKLYNDTFQIHPLQDIIQFSHTYPGKLEIDISSEEKINTLIENIPFRLATEYTGVDKDAHESLKRIEPQNVQQILNDCLKKKNAYYSKRMILYNIFSSSMTKNAIYAMQKLRKGILKR